MRLFMSYLATHPEKLDPVKKQQWAKLARLDAQDMDTVCNMAYLNVAVMKQPGSQVTHGVGVFVWVERGQCCCECNGGVWIGCWCIRQACHGTVTAPIYPTSTQPTAGFRLVQQCQRCLRPVSQSPSMPLSPPPFPTAGVQRSVLQLAWSAQEEGNLPQA